MREKTIPCSGCGATKNSERCVGCLHHFGTPDSDWVNKHRPVEPLKPDKYKSKS
jgi:hypothetical protein